MEKFVASSIRSVVNQTYTNWELIIVDDASTDKTVDVVNEFKNNDPRIKLVIHDNHAGIAAARNLSIRLAKGNYLAFLDADDIWKTDKLQKQLMFMERNHLGFSYSSYDCIDEQGEKLGKTIRTAGDLNYVDYLHNTIIGCSTVLVNTDITGSISVPDFRTSEDTATWLNILKNNHKAYAFDEILVSYRIRKKSASSNKLKAAFDLWKVYRSQKDLSLPKTIECFCSYVYHSIKKRL